jgi:hypothetical protein
MTVVALATLITLAAPAGKSAADLTKLQTLDREWQSLRDHKTAPAAANACSAESAEVRAHKLAAGFRELTQSAEGDTLEKSLIGLGDVSWFLAKQSRSAKIPVEISKQGPSAISSYQQKQVQDETDDRTAAIGAWNKAVEMADAAAQKDLEIDRIKAQLKMLTAGAN